MQFACAACIHVSRSVDSPVRFSDGRSTPLCSLFLAPSSSLYFALVFSPSFHACHVASWGVCLTECSDNMQILGIKLTTMSGR